MKKHLKNCIVHEMQKRFNRKLQQKFSFYIYDYLHVVLNALNYTKTISSWKLYYLLLTALGRTM